MTKTYAIEVLENTRIELLDQIDVLNSLGTGNFDGKRRELSDKLNNVKASISTLNENRGIKITSESGTIFFGNGNVKFEGNLELSPAKLANEQNVTQVSNKYIVEDCKSITINEKGLFINAGSVNFVPCKYKWSPTTETSNVTSIIDRIWNETKELINESNKNNITQNITINAESEKDFDIAKFSEQLTKALKRERGAR